MTRSPPGTPIDMQPLAELISTGAELLGGRTVNRHASLLGGRLADLGIRLARDTTLPDDRAAIAAAIREALARVDLVFTSGGLGPTNDDLTREAICDALGCGMAESPEGIAWIEDRLRRAGRTMRENSRRQALQIDGATLLDNPAGVAPGQRVDLPGGKTVFVLPGPPREFDAILETHILPWLAEHAAAVRPHTLNLMFCGVGESDLHAFLEPRVDESVVELAYCAAPGRVEVRLTTAGDRSAVDAIAAALRSQFPEFLYAEQREGIGETVARLLNGTGRTLAVAESCTGGLLGGRITDIAGSSSFFRGGVIAYANEVKTAQLGVPEEILKSVGAVSEEVARLMAGNVRDRLGATYGLSVTGVAGPGGGSPEKPVGLVWLACSGPSGTRVQRCQFGGDRSSVRENAVQRALWLLWRELTASAPAENPSVRPAREEV
ncbi:MAG: competence/damage-inducible protein A [Kiritimatiellia bacterium]